MCVVSMIGDHFKDRWTHPHPYVNPFPPIPEVDTEKFIHGIKIKEFMALKEEVRLLKELIKQAVAYDKKNNEPHCEMEAKMKFIREVAKAVGVSLEDVLESETKEKSS